MALFAVAVVEGFDTCFDTCLNIIASMSVPVSEQGRALGALAFVRAVLNVAAPLLGNSLWSATVEWDPAFTFYILSGMSALSLLLGIRLRWLLVDEDVSSADLGGGVPTKASREDRLMP